MSDLALWREESKTPNAELEIRGWAAPHGWNRNRVIIGRREIPQSVEVKGPWPVEAPIAVCPLPVLRYGIAAASFAIALGLAVLAQRYGFQNVEAPLFLFAVAVTAWYAGPGPAALAVVLSIALFDYFFMEPRYTFYVRSSDIPYLIVFISFALLVAWFSAVRRRVEGELRQARDEIQIEVAERTRQASLLNLTQAEKNLRRSETYLAEAQKLSHTGSFGWDVSSGEIYWSQETLRIFEYEPTTKVTTELIMRRTHPEDRLAVRQLIERVSRERTEFDFEHRLLMPDGSVKYLRVVGHPSNDERAPSSSWSGY